MQKFGGKHTTDKLDVIEKYLNAYTTALSKQNFNLIYFDAFAGTGSVDVTNQIHTTFDQKQLELMNDVSSFEGVNDIATFTDGSAKRALQISRSFDEYIFVEKDAAKSRELLTMRSDFPKVASKIRVKCGDANTELEEFCDSTDWGSTRAVVFLDPFGNQVAWTTIEKIAQTRAIDLWYLFPSFWGVFRQISNAGKMTAEQENSMIRLFGTDEWKSKWISVQDKKQPDLFDGSQTESKKQVEVDEITRFMIKRMQRVFEGGVLESWLSLGKNGAHRYSLLFAWANPSKKAKLAAKLARACMNRK